MTKGPPITVTINDSLGNLYSVNYVSSGTYTITSPSAVINNTAAVAVQLSYT